LLPPCLRCLIFAALFVTPAAAQTSSGAANAGTSSEWSFRVAAATYVLPDDDDYVQPTVAADRGRLHLESRYNYEDRESVSAFAGWNFQAGKQVTLALTPMAGAVVGDTQGIVPGLEVTLSFWRVELYGEGEYVIDTGHVDDSYFYNWSELTIAPVDWLRAGLATQRTRTLHDPRDIQRGILAGLTFGRLEGTFYYFNPGSSDHYLVFSLGLDF